MSREIEGHSETLSKSDAMIAKSKDSKTRFY